MSGGGVKREGLQRDQEATSVGGDKFVHYIDYSDGFKSAYIHENLSSCTL